MFALHQFDIDHLPAHLARVPDAGPIPGLRRVALFGHPPGARNWTTGLYPTPRRLTCGYYYLDPDHNEHLHISEIPWTHTVHRGARPRCWGIRISEAYEHLRAPRDRDYVAHEWVDPPDLWDKRLAVLRTYLNNGGEFEDAGVLISRHHRFEDGPYVDTIPFSVGSNQTILPPHGS